MDHTKVIEDGFVERYLLGELTPVQRDQFEEHFFDCEICAADVEAGAVFIDNARAVLRADEQMPFSGQFAKYGLPFQSAALLSVGLAAVLGYQNIAALPYRQATTPSRRPELEEQISFIGVARSASQTTTVNGKQDVRLEIAIPGKKEFVRYELRILDGRGALKFPLSATSDQVKEPVLLNIPASSLSTGRYVISGVGKKSDGSEQELTRDSIFVK